MAPTTITMAASKSGVGKATLTGLLAVAASQARRRVLAVDADPQSSLLSWARDPDGLGDRVKVIGFPVTSKLERELPAVAAAFDVVVLDCPPGAGDRAITEAALRAATVAVSR